MSSDLVGRAASLARFLNTPRRAAAIVGTGWALICTAAWLPAAAQLPPSPPEPQRGGTFHPPPARVNPIYLPSGPNGMKQDTGEPAGPRLRGVVLVDIPLRVVSSGAGRQGSAAVSPTAQVEVQATPLDNPLFAKLTLVRYLRPDRQRPWNPDFTYSFGWDDPRPATFSLVYTNFTGTRFNPDKSRGERRFNFSEGTWTGSYKFMLPQALEPIFLVGDGDQALCNAALNLVPRFSDASGARLQHKTFGTLGCRYTTAGGWFAHFTAFAWRKGQQQPWDPDFTYGFGYEPGPEGGLGVSYNNYSGNRWPGRSRNNADGGLRGGSVTFSWSASW